MRNIVTILFTLSFFGLFSQTIKYKADVEPLLSKGYVMGSLPTLEKYYDQNLKNGKPTPQALQYLKPKMNSVIMHVGHTYEKHARENKNYPTTDSAIQSINEAIKWYEKIWNDYQIKNDTLNNYIAALKQLPDKWTEDNKTTVRKIQEYKETFKSNLLRIQVYDETKALELQEKHKNAVFVNEYKAAALESGDVLSDIEREKELEEKKRQEAARKKAEIQAEQAKEKARTEFLALQKKCVDENQCPNCPIEVAVKFRDAYYAGDVDAMKALIIDYYGDGNLFYEKHLNIFSELTEERKQELGQEFRAQTDDYKKTDPVNVVYYTDNEDKDFFIDRNYKSYLLQATVFQVINDYDKVDLVKYQGKWYVYRVGGAYGGRSGNTIVNGKFHLDPRFLQKEVKQRKK